MQFTYPQRPSMRSRARSTVRAIFERNFPAPTKGWVTNKNISNMKPDEALLMDNWFPYEDDVALRPGNQVWSTGIGTTDVETVIGYNGSLGNKVLAAGSGNIYDITVAGAGVLLQGGFSGNRWQHTQLTIVGSGTYTVMVNGVDTPQRYDGTTVVANTFTGAGLDPTQLIDIIQFKGRLLAVQKNTLSFWFLTALNTFQGAMSRYDLGTLFKLGGSLASIATWTRDGGDGIDDACCFISTMGEVAIFFGTNPGDANAWSLQGVFRIGSPMGTRCWCKYASDIVLLTQNGFLPLSAVLSAQGTNEAVESLSNNIAPTVNQVAALYKNNFGWEPVVFPSGRQLVVNVPIGVSATNVQYVMNTNTGAWCRFTGLAIKCFGLAGDNLYFGSSGGTVWRWAEGTSDNGAAITGQVKIAFNYMGDRGSFKKFDMVRPVLQSDGDLSYSFKVNTDFRDETPDVVTTSQGGGTAWDAGAWDTTSWGDAYTTFQQWRAANATGRCAALNLRVSTAVNTVGLVGVDWRYERGAGLG